MRPHHKAEHMAAHDQIIKTPKTPCHAGAVHTGFQLVAENSEKLEDDTLFAWAARKQVVHPIEDEYTDIDLFHQLRCSCLQFGQGPPRVTLALQLHVPLMGS